MERNEYIDLMMAYYRDKGFSDKRLESISNYGVNVYYNNEKINLIANLILAKPRDTRILIYGDYDVDGLTAATVLKKTLNRLGFANIMTKIPQHKEDGYGINSASIRRIFEGGQDAKLMDNSARRYPGPYKPQLVLTCDNGVSIDQPTVDYLKQQDAELIVTDHHTKPDNIAVAEDHLLHTDDLPYSAVSGATLASKLAYDMLHIAGIDDPELSNEIDQLVAMSVCSDVMPLSDENNNPYFENRGLLRLGLDRMQETPIPQIEYACSIFGLNCVTLSKEGLDFRIVPFGNASMRMGDSRDFFEYLNTPDPHNMRSTGNYIKSVNERRKQDTRDAFTYLIKEGSYEKHLSEDHYILVKKDDLSEGIIGLVAGDFCRKFGVPAIAVSRSELGGWRGSARCIAGINLIAKLREHEDLFTTLGGHPGAAGFTISDEGLAELEKVLSFPVIAQENNTFIDVTGLSDMKDLSSALGAFAPLGQGLPKPLVHLHIDDLQSVSITPKGHLKFIDSDWNQFFLYNTTLSSADAKELNKLTSIDLVGELDYTPPETKLAFSVMSYGTGNDLDCHLEDDECEC